MLTEFAEIKLASETVKAIVYLLDRVSGGLLEETGSKLLSFIQRKIGKLFDIRQIQETERNLTPTEREKLKQLIILALEDNEFKEKLESNILNFQATYPESGVTYQNITANKTSNTEVNIENNNGVGVVNDGGRVNIDNRSFRR